MLTTADLLEEIAALGLAFINEYLIGGVTS
jgi:hypothetical protein